MADHDISSDLEPSGSPAPAIQHPSSKKIKKNQRPPANSLSLPTRTSLNSAHTVSWSTNLNGPGKWLSHQAYLAQPCLALRPRRPLPGLRSWRLLMTPPQPPPPPQLGGSSRQVFKAPCQPSPGLTLRRSISRMLLLLGLSPRPPSRPSLPVFIPQRALLPVYHSMSNLLWQKPSHASWWRGSFRLPPPFSIPPSQPRAPHHGDHRQDYD